MSRERVREKEGKLTCNELSALDVYMLSPQVPPLRSLPPVPVKICISDDFM